MRLPQPHPHPWQRVAELGHITVHFDQDIREFGRCKHSTQEIFIRRGLTQAQRRATVLHELTHLERGPAVRGFVRQDELQTREAAARWLIPFDNLVDGLIWCGDDRELAHHLWVDLGTVRTRLHTLTPAEDELLNLHLDRAELTFPK